MRDSGLDKPSTALFHLLTGVESDLLRRVGLAQHSRPHSGVIVISGRTDNGDAVPHLHKAGDVGKGDHVGMPTAD